LSALLDIQELAPDNIERVIIPFGEWLPDMPELNNPGAVEALNVIPAEGCYIPFPQHSPDDVAVVPDQVRGAIAVIDADDIVQLYAGTTSAVYTKLGGGSPGNAFGGIVTVPVSSQPWKFIRVNEQMVILHPDVFPLRHPVGTTVIVTAIGGNPPRAACGAQVGDFLMLGDLLEDPDDFGNAFPSRVRWSGFNNIDLPWISSPVTQADFQDMPAAGGPVRAIAGREYGTIYQERMISRATYRGPPTIFDIVTVEDQRGAIARDSIVDIGPFQFFIAEDGFYYWNGTNSNPIGDNKINRYFFNRLEYSQRSKICGGVDFVTGCVMWAFPTDASGILNEIIIFSYRENKFSHSIQDLDFLVSSAASNITIDDLTGSLESYSGSFDDAAYSRGGRAHIAAFNTNHKYGLFDGAPMAAIVDTSEATGPDGRRIFVNNVRPIVDLAVPQATVQLAKRDQMIGAPIGFSAPVAQEIDGQCPVVDDARYMRFRVNIPVDATWQHAAGVEVARKAAGVF
jgi:hypothetical protein